MSHHFDVFISSTKTDLEAFREATNRVIRQLNMFPVDMVDFQPDTSNALQFCYNALRDSELFVGIYAHKYGYCPDTTVTYVDKDGNTRAGDGVTSITEWEYRWAIELNIPIMLFVLEEDALWQDAFKEKGDAKKRLTTFKAHIGKYHIIKYFTSLEHFEKLLYPALARGYQQLFDSVISEQALQPRTLEQIQQAEQNALYIVDHSHSPIRQNNNKTRLIGVLPKDFSNESFFNRTAEQANATNYIQSRASLVSIYGRGGVGKTALACKVLGDFEKNTPADVMAVFRMDDLPHPSAMSILYSLSRLFPVDHVIHTLIKNPQTTIIAKTNALLDSLDDKHLLLYLDNLESIQDPDSHHITDAGIQDFLNTILTRRDGAISVLVTSRYPVPFDNKLKIHEKKIPLDVGFPHREAIAFLRELDGDKGLLPEDDDYLIAWIDKVGGFPRALEALVGYLDGGMMRHLDDLTDTIVADTEVVSHIVHQVHDSLPEAFRKVIQAVAIIGQKTTYEELLYLLAPYLDSSNLRAILERLTESRFVVYNRQSRTFGLHHYDLRYAIDSIPVGNANDAHTAPLPFTRYALNYRMAELYCSQRLPKEQWKTLDDLYPQLREIVFRVALEDYDAAAAILFEIDWDYLMVWGHVQIAYDLHKNLQGKIQTHWMSVKNLKHLGRTCWQMGRSKDAIGYFENALAVNSTRDDNMPASASIFGNLGLAYYDLGQIETAIEKHEQAIALARQFHDKHVEGITLGNLGLAYSRLGKIETAIDYYEKALIFDDEMQDKRSKGYDLGYLGLAYMTQKAFAKALIIIQDAITIMKEVHDIRGLQRNLGNLARAYWHMGDLQTALATIREARQFDSPQVNHVVAVRHGAIAWCCNQSEEATTAFHDALAYTDDILSKTPNYYEALYVRALALAGLWVVGNHDHYTQASDAYTKAVNVASFEGVLIEHRMLLEALLACSDKDGGALVTLLMK